MTDKENILNFPGSEPLPVNPIQSESSAPFNYCQHGQISLDDHTRTLHCLLCKAILDPFNFLLKQSHLLQSAWREHKYVSDRLREKHESLLQLGKEEKRLKARIKTLNEKQKAAGAVIDVRGGGPL